jgi:anti-sigma factor ChrR (cupin superfamily)
VVLLSSSTKKNENKTVARRQTPDDESCDDPDNPALWESIQAMPKTSDSERARQYAAIRLYNTEMSPRVKQSLFAQYGISYNLPQEEGSNLDVD